jgi:putative DNA-invertase from lambdoid prophage Rac
MKVCLYARVSTDEQTEQSQIPTLEKWASDKGWEIVGTYRETGTAWQNSDQKVLRQMLEDCRRGLANTVLIYDLSRSTRQGTYYQLWLIRQFTQAGVEVRSFMDSWLEQITNPSMREAMIGFLAAIHETDSRVKSQKTKDGMARAKAEGKHIGRPRKSKDSIPEVKNVKT